MTLKLALLVVVASALAAASLAGATSVGAGTAGGGGCPPISAAQVQSILGFAQSLQQRNTVNHSGDALDHLCSGVAWSGATPTNPQASLQTAKTGHGAAFGIETWHPNTGSPDVGQWPKDFAKMVAGWVQDHIVWPGVFGSIGWPSNRLSPPPLGHAGAGIIVKPQGPATGLAAAAACWWDHDTQTAVCLLDEEASFRPVVKHLYQLAKIAVPKVLG
jgi:hypothetical protein